MRPTGRVTYQFVVAIIMAMLGIGTVASLLWLDSRHRAIPLQPAPVANKPAPAAGERPAAAALLSAIKTHVVAEGETLSHIAALYHIDIDTIIGANPQLSEILHPGEKLTILPQAGVLHLVSEGDTLWSISRQYDVLAGSIAAANGIEGDLIIAGQSLFIPGAKPVRKGNRPSRAGDGRFLWPVSGELTSDFGYRWGRQHAGIDIAAETGRPVRCARSGHVRYAGWYGGYGYTVLVDHYQGYATLYAHLDECVVKKGEALAAGAIVGYVGSTGLSTGPHLHFEIHRQGVPVNPLALLP